MENPVTKKPIRLSAGDRLKLIGVMCAVVAVVFVTGLNEELMKCGTAV